MAYNVRIRNNETGEVRTRAVELEWSNDEGCLYWWRSGNFSCDCNRALVWDDSLGECGNSRYTVIDATLNDGRIIPIDDIDDEYEGEISDDNP
jgi:hypothetical protein